MDNSGWEAVIMNNTKAYVLISLRECDEQDVLQKLLKLPEVEEVHILFGEWDIIVKIAAKATEDIATFVMEHIRKMPEVKLSSTMIVAR